MGPRLSLYDLRKERLKVAQPDVFLIQNGYGLICVTFEHTNVSCKLQCLQDYIMQVAQWSKE